MSYSKDLGYIKGKTGSFVKPKEPVVDSSDPSKTIISWELKNEVDEEVLSDTIIQTIYFEPYITSDDPYTLKWKSNVDGIPPINSMDLPRGQAGIPGVNIEVIPTYSGITTDLDRIRYHYNGGLKTNYEQIEEGTIFLILDKDNPNDLTQKATIAYVYDKEKDTYTNDTPMYVDDAFIVIEHPIDLTNYYSKQETYSKEEIDGMFGQITASQNRIISILDSGLIEFETTPEEPEDNTGD